MQTKQGIWDRLVVHRWAKALIFITLMGGLLYLALAPMDTHANADTTCTLRNFTGIACPGCGMGRGLHLMLNGQMSYALWMNPFVLLILLGTFWIMGTAAVDTVKGTQHTVRALENITKYGQKFWWIWAPLLLLNWLWNIDKFS